MCIVDDIPHRACKIVIANDQRRRSAFRCPYATLDGLLGTVHEHACQEARSPGWHIFLPCGVH